MIHSGLEGLYCNLVYLKGCMYMSHGPSRSGCGHAVNGYDGASSNKSMELNVMFHSYQLALNNAHTLLE